MSRERIPIDVARAARLYRRGLTLRQVAARLGCAHRTVHTRLKEAGIPLRAHGKRCVPIEELQRRWRAGESVVDISTELGITDMAVYNRLRRHGTPPRPDPRGARGRRP